MPKSSKARRALTEPIGGPQIVLANGQITRAGGFVTRFGLAGRRGQSIKIENLCARYLHSHLASSLAWQVRLPKSETLRKRTCGTLSGSATRKSRQTGHASCLCA